MSENYTVVFRVKDWVLEYFGEDYLSLYYFPEERTEKEANFIEKVLRARIFTGNTPKQPPKIPDLAGGRYRQSPKILDLACGQGRHSIKLAERGFNVLGLDYQEVLLDIARKNCAKAANGRTSSGRASNGRASSGQAASGQATESAGRTNFAENIAFLQGDMRKLAYCEEFDAVLNLFTAFGFFDDETNNEIMGKIAAAIKKNGIFFQDLANKKYQLRETKPAWERITHNGLRVENVWAFDQESKCYTHKQWLHKKNGQIREFSHTVRIYDFFEIEEIYGAHGLEILDVYGDYGGNVYDKSDSPRMIIVAKKL